MRKQIISGNVRSLISKHISYGAMSIDVYRDLEGVFYPQIVKN